MSSRGSVTSCIQGLKAGKEAASQEVEERYFARSAFKGIGSTDGEEGIERVIHEQPGPATLMELAEEYEPLLESLGDDTLRQIAIWSMEGHTNQEIAKMLDCSLRTVARKLDLIRTI